MRRTSGSSIRVSPQTRRRVGNLARKIHASSQQEVIEKALDALEQRHFWEGFDQEARAYLQKYPEESQERDRFGQISGDGLKR